MKNFDEKEAVDFIVNKILGEYPGYDRDKCREYIEKMMSVDFEFMRDTGVIVDGAFMSEAYYEDDDAFCYVAERMMSRIKDEDEQLCSDLLEGYFEYFEQYMEKCDLLSWE